MSTVQQPSFAKPRSLRVWQSIHTWSGLICTLFLLILCVTGLPLIFHHEIDQWTGHAPRPPAMPPDTPRSDLDRVVAAGLARVAGLTPQFVFFPDDEPNAVGVSLGVAAASDPADNRTVMVDARDARVLLDPDHGEGVMEVIRSLHVDLFAGLPGKLFLGAMGLAFVLAMISGVVVYGPFLKKYPFGVVRRDRDQRITWLDQHNLVGAAAAVWLIAVGATGVLNSWADLVIQLWRVDQLAAMTAPYRDRPALTGDVSVEAAVAAARRAEPALEVSFVAYPGTLFSSPHHFAVFMRGTEPLTARLLKPVLIDAQASTVTDSRDLPFYVTALLVAQPLHFGDYGGAPLKVIWAVLTCAAIFVLTSGLYIYALRPKNIADDNRRPMVFAGKK